MRLVSSEDGTTWDHHLDLDPTDWLISAPGDGRQPRVASRRPTGLHFQGALQETAPQRPTSTREVASPMSPRWAPRSPSRTSSRPETRTNPTSRAVRPTPWPNARRTPEPAWTRPSTHPRPTTPSQADCPTRANPSAPRCQAPTSHPEVAIHGSKVHVIWKNSGTGQVMYLRGHVGRCTSWRNLAAELRRVI